METVVVVSGPVILQAHQSPVKETPYSTPVVAVVSSSERQETAAVIVTMAPFPVVLTASCSTAAVHPNSTPVVHVVQHLSKCATGLTTTVMDQ